MLQRILTWEEAEAKSGITARQLKKAVADGKLKAFWKNSKEYGVTEKSLEDYFNDNVVNPLQLKRI